MTMVELLQKLKVSLSIIYVSEIIAKIPAKHDPYHSSTSMLKLNACISIRFKASRVTTEAIAKATLTPAKKLLIYIPIAILFLSLFAPGCQ